MLLLVGFLPILYVFTYIMLRVCGVYYPFFDQGSWEIEGSTRVFVLDVVFWPAQVIEGEIQNRLRWLPEPKGG